MSADAPTQRLDTDLGHDAPDTLVLSLDTTPGLTAKVAEERGLAGHRAGDVGRRVAAFYFADLADRNLHQQRGCSSLSQYAKQRLCMAPARLLEYVRVGRALRELPEIDRGFQADEIGWTKVRALTRVATPKTQTAWAEWASCRTTDEVRQHVKRREKGDLPTDPDRRTIHTTTSVVNARLTPVSTAVWELFRETLVDKVFGGPVSDNDLLMYLAYKEVREITGEPLTLRTANPQLDPRNYGAEEPFEERHAKTDKKLRQTVRKRDGDKCVSCGSKWNLSVHHIHWRRYGGPTVAENLVTLCEGCHSLVHDRFLILHGGADELIFLDAEGECFGVHERRRYVLPVRSTAEALTPGDSPRGESGQLFFRDLPKAVDDAWWRRHSHLFRYDQRSGGLVFEPGVAVEQRDGPASDVEKLETSPGLDALVGQRRVRDNLRISIRAAADAGEPLAHVLLLGAPGLGKTSIARAVASELGGPFDSVMAPLIGDPAALLRHLTSLRPASVFFLDEVHALRPRVAEVLYDALEAGQVDVPVRWGSEQRSLRIRLAPFTLVAATTEEGSLPEPLLGRFVYQERMEFYGREELGMILDRELDGTELSQTPEARDWLAGASRDTPRTALSLLRVVRDEARAAGVSIIDEAMVSEALGRRGTSARGLVAFEIGYLRLLAECRAQGLSTLAAQLGTSRRNVRRVFEPFLLRRGLVRITPRGRFLTAEGRVALAAATEVSRLTRSA